MPDQVAVIVAWLIVLVATAVAVALAMHEWPDVLPPPLRRCPGAAKTAGMDEVLQHFLGAVDDLGSTPDPVALASAVHDLAVDLDYWRFHIDRAGESSVALHRPDRGVQVILARRTDGTMSYVHSHEVWVALSAIVGVETHRRYDVERLDDEHALATMAEERRLQGGAGDVVTLVPPLDVHSHGHVRGSGAWPYTLIVLGDNQLRYQREEYDLTNRRRRILAPGDRGTTDLPEPV